MMESILNFRDSIYGNALFSMFFRGIYFYVFCCDPSVLIIVVMKLRASSPPERPLLSHPNSLYFGPKPNGAD